MRQAEAAKSILHLSPSIFSQRYNKDANADGRMQSRAFKNLTRNVVGSTTSADQRIRDHGRPTEFGPHTTSIFLAKLLHRRGKPGTAAASQPLLSTLLTLNPELIASTNLPGAWNFCLIIQYISPCLVESIKFWIQSCVILNY
uniref:Uncharacterized protein n=2 Tax=Opuntia streptacantha TaxID=393608 RepID=A0A7C8ZFV3_OPUST